MRVATYNVHKCVGADGRFRPDRVAAVIAELDADLVALQEVDRRFGHRSGLLDAALLRSGAGLRLLSQSDLPDGQGWHGNAILVRGEPTFYRRRRMHLPGVEQRGAVLAEIDMGSGPIRYVASHLGLLRKCRYRQAGAILSALAELNPMPTVLMGDLNEWRSRRGSALSVLEPFFGQPKSRPSFPARLPLFSLDRIMGWPMDLVGDIEVHDTALARQASDHLPLKAELRHGVHVTRFLEDASA